LVITTTEESIVDWGWMAKVPWKDYQN